MTTVDQHQDNVSEKEGKNSFQDGERRPSLAQRQARGSVASTAAERARRNLNMKLANPLDGYDLDELKAMGRDYAKIHAIAEPEDIRAFELGAILAQNPEKFERIKDQIAIEEMNVLEKEYTNRWSQPRLLYLVIILCSTCAAVQGMGESLPKAESRFDVDVKTDETVVNGAQLFYTKQFGIGGVSTPKAHKSHYQRPSLCGN
jgi:hypothetical protein